MAWSEIEGHERRYQPVGADCREERMTLQSGCHTRVAAQELGGGFQFDGTVFDSSHATFNHITIV
jgi:hypothetical protein